MIMIGYNEVMAMFVDQCKFSVMYAMCLCKFYAICVHDILCNFDAMCS